MTSLGDALATFEHDAWRLEVRDVYAVPAETDRINEYLRTGLVTPSPKWTRVVRAATGRDASIGRVRLVGYPITGYTRYELAAYDGNVEAGESVHLVDRRWLDRSWDAAPDFWLIDGQVWLMRYDHAGAFLGAEVAPDPRPYLELRARLGPIAVPLTEFTPGDIPAPRPPMIPLPASLTTTG